MKKLIKTFGISALTLGLMLNMQNSLFDYGLSEINLGSKLMAQTGETLPEDDPWLNEMPSDVDTEGDLTAGSNDINTVKKKYKLKQVICIKLGANISFPIKKSTFTASLGNKFSCRSSAPDSCDISKQTSCN